MTEIKIEKKLLNYQKALQQLSVALNEPIDTKKMVIDATIQRFEYCYELTWKTVKVFLEKEGIIADTPKTVFQKAYAAQWIDNETIWLDMIEDRNLTSHVYKEEIALSVYQHIKNYYPEMKKLSVLLTRKLPSS